MMTPKPRWVLGEFARAIAVGANLFKGKCGLSDFWLEYRESRCRFNPAVCYAQPLHRLRLVLEAE
jgi:hypothetical protein